MSDRMIDQIFHRLAQAPVGLDCTFDQVLGALGMMASAILAVGFSGADRQARADGFCAALQACLAQLRRPLN